MDWQMIAVYLFCAAFALYVAGLLTGFCYELFHGRPHVPDKAMHNKPDETAKFNTKAA